MPVNTPKTGTQSLSRCLLTFEDGSTLEIEVKDQQGFYRTNEYKAKNEIGILTHEIYITEKA